MVSIGTDSSSRPHLRLLAPPPRSVGALARERICELPRCRPGEFPLILRCSPPAALLRALHGEASAQCVTVELWARLAIEAGLILSDLEKLGLAPKVDIVRALDLESGPPPALNLEATTPSAASYLRALRAGRSGPPPGPTLELFVPEDMGGAWRLAAIEAGDRLDEWLKAQLSVPRPNSLLAWEMSAAAAHLSLREWCYAAWTRRIAIRTASPRRRTALSGLSS
jgi:hypothetical protein